MTQASILNKYSVADASGKVDIICKNYSNFLEIIDGFIEEIRYMIEEEKMYKRAEARGDLGVRVQTLGHYSDVTSNTATNRVITRDAIITCNFDDELFEGVEHKEQFCEAAYLLRRMRKDYELFNAQLRMLQRDELKLFLLYLNGEKDIIDIAEEEGILYASVVQRLRRSKVKIKVRMADCMKRIA